MITPRNLTGFSLLISIKFRYYRMSWFAAVTGENHTLTLYEIKHTFFFHLVKAYLSCWQTLLGLNILSLYEDQ